MGVAATLSKLSEWTLCIFVGYLVATPVTKTTGRISKKNSCLKSKKENLIV